MSHRKRHHDGHDGDDGHDGFRFKMRLPSPLPDETERVMTRVIDCAIDVHRQLGPGFLESIYQKAMGVALSRAGMPFEQEKPIEVIYNGVAIPASAWTSLSLESWSSS